MAEAFVNVTEGSGKKLHTFDRTIGANSVHDEVVLLGEPYLASYCVAANDVPFATGAFRCLTINAGGSLNVVIDKVEIHQHDLAGGAAAEHFRIRRLSTAASGGTDLTPEKMDPGDAASGATSKQEATGGTLGNTILIMPRMPLLAAASGGAATISMWERSWGRKGIVIPAGTGNGIAICSAADGGVATATVDINVWFTERSF